uniref:Terpene synthase metal-binding domain-containing protein n=1 Tax=Leersia perrieri TaxID=77586 RepID=A0A0D9W9C2_9ORYZ
MRSQEEGEGDDCEVDDVVFRVRNTKHELLQLFETGERREAPVIQRWSPPMEGFVVRNHNGTALLAGAGRRTSVHDALCAEAEAWIAAAMVQGITKITIETDSATLVSALRSQEYDQSPGGAIFVELKLLLQLEFAEVATVHKPRSCNSVAHELAQVGVSMERGQSSVWTDPFPNFRLQANREVDLSLSPYDTAWMAMVPLEAACIGDSPPSSSPRFPQCVEWILQNQHDDGSWRSVNKDVLSSTLACVLALVRWDTGREHVRRGLQFVGSNISVAMDEQTFSPVGFNVTFAAMLRDDVMICSGGRKADIAYAIEGLRSLQDWNEVMKLQRKNGPLFNSPSTTAAELVHKYATKALQYLDMLLDKFGAVPVAYPVNIQYQLYMVDVLEKLGIASHFFGEISSILDMTYSCWLQRNDEIMLDMATCGMAFRLLRMNGYDVSSDELSHLAEPSSFHGSLQGFINDTRSLLELHNASKVSISEKDTILDNIGSWTSCLLKEKLLSSPVPRTPLFEEASCQVEYALSFPFYTTLDRLDHKRNIEHFDNTCCQMLEVHFPCHSNEEIMALGVRDFSCSQFIYQEELHQLGSWVKENRLDQLQFARQKLEYFYFSAGATMFHPELSDVRILWAKNGVLTTVVDDFFDVGGSKEELENLVALVEKWDKNDRTEYYSEQVEIVEWRQSQYVPTAEEYMENAVVTFALGPIVLPALYLVGPKLPDSVVRSQECSELFRLMSTCGRLLNDVQSYEREGTQGKLNSVSLLALQSGGSVTMEEAVKEIQKPVEKCRRELLNLVVSRECVIPRPCKDLFWNMCKVCYFFYSGSDGFSSPTAKAGAVNAVIHEPLLLNMNHLSPRHLASAPHLHGPPRHVRSGSQTLAAVADATASPSKAVPASTPSDTVVAARALSPSPSPSPWQELLRYMMEEVEWRKRQYVPTIEEYMENAVVSFALGPILLPAIYFVGPKIPDSVVRSQECNELFRLVSTMGRLLNDFRSYERECREGKLNSVFLLVLHSGGSVSMEEAVEEIQKPIEKCRRDLLRLVLSKDSTVPRPCKELFWNMSKCCYFFYSRGDGFSSPTAKAGAVKAVIHEPLQL